MYKKLAAGFLGISSVFLVALPAFAHVIVHPDQVGIAALQEFTLSVPTEKDNPTVALKLLIPDGVKMVIPNVKSGWTITEKKNGDGEDAIVTEIDWTDGSIPSGQRDDFYFQAQVPAKETLLHWKAYQTYSDGSVVSWDHDPKLSKGADDDSVPPYSTTKVVNDLAAKPTAATVNSETEARTNRFMILSGTAFALSIAAIAMQVIRRK